MDDYQHPAPQVRLVVNGRDLTGEIRPRLESLTLTDNRGLEADQLDLVLDDSDAQLDLPPRGAEISLALGWVGDLVDKGTFTVDEVEHSGAPDKLTIRARSADLRASLSAKVERSWHGATVGAIARAIARAHKLDSLVADDLAREVISHIDQTGESDANLLTRIAEQFDAVASIKAGKVLLFRAGQGRSASGKLIPPVPITRQSGDGHRFAIADSANYTAVLAAWHDSQSGKRGEVLIDATNRKPKGGGKRGKTAYEKPKIQPSSDNTKRLRHVYASQASALRGARSAYDKLARGVASLSITLALGRADITPETPVTVSGFKPAIDSAGWIVAKATHSVTDSGFTTALELELRGED